MTYVFKVGEVLETTVSIGWGMIPRGSLVDVISIRESPGRQGNYYNCNCIFKDGTITVFPFISDQLKRLE